jgi:hypothetical protein
MTKEQTIASIKKAREAHELQMDKIQAIISGKEVENPTAVEKTKCEFGQWLYADENHVKEIIGHQFYENLDLKHEKWHIEYIRIFNIFFKEKNKGFFSKLLGLKNIDPLELDKAKLYHAELQETTKELLKALGSAERRISALNESKFR